MRNVLLLTIFLLLCTTLVFAQQETIRFYHPQETNLTVYEKCRVNGEVCDMSYTCSLSVISEDQELIIDSVTMLGDGAYRNYTLLSQYTAENGIYEATVDCDNGSYAGSNTFYYQITPNGSVPVETGQGLTLLGAITLFILIIVSLGYLGIKARNPTVSLAFLGFAGLLMIFGIGFALNVLEVSFGTFSNIINNYSTIYVVFIYLAIAGSIGFILYLIYVALKYYWDLRGYQDRFTFQTD